VRDGGGQDGLLSLVLWVFILRFAAMMRQIAPVVIKINLFEMSTTMVVRDLLPLEFICPVMAGLAPLRNTPGTLI